MKKIVLLFLSILVTVSLIGCATPSEPTAELAPTPIITPSSTLEPTPTATPEPTVEPTVKPTAKPTVQPTAKPTAKPTTEPTAQPTAKPTQNPSTTPKPTVVQRANPDTGISWDGKSAIVYTYPDGTTGTEKRVGAKYEAYPGVIYTIEQAEISSPTPSAYVGICSYCGKTEKDGTNGTCLRYWTGGDHVCAHCGVTVPVKTCHTCK